MKSTGIFNRDMNVTMLFWGWFCDALKPDYIASNCWDDWWWRIGSNFKRSYHDIIEALSRHLSEWNEETNKKHPVKIDGVPAEFRNEYLRNTLPLHQPAMVFSWCKECGLKYCVFIFWAKTILEQWASVRAVTCDVRSCILRFRGSGRFLP
jgi:hypothetical protein